MICHNNNVLARTMQCINTLVEMVITVLLLQIINDLLHD